MATQASTPSPAVASSSASSSAATLDTLSGAEAEAATSFFTPLLPYIDRLPDYLGLTELQTPYPYALSIVIATVVMRSLVTLPVSLWQRARTRRMVEIVAPQWNRIKHDLPQEVLRRSRLNRKSHDEYRATVQAELKSSLQALIKQNRCSPIPTIAVPLAVNIPIFIGISWALQTALAAKGLPIAAETVPWWSPPPELMAKFEEGAKILQARGMEGEALQKLTTIQGPTLSEIDKTMVTPIGLGMLTMINVELGQWLRKPLIEGTADEAGPAAEDQRRRTAPVVQEKSIAELRSKVIGNTLRFASIAFVVVASQAPSGLVIYWLTSAVFTLAQNAIFARVDAVRSSRKRVQ